MIPNKDIKVIPLNQYKQIMNLFNNIYEEFFVDQEENRKKYYLQAFNIIKKRVIELFSSNCFWTLYSLSRNCCDHVYGKNSKYCGEICGRTIELKFDGKNYRCSRHIGIKHVPIPNNISEKEKCKGVTKYNRPCKRRATKDIFCVYHYNEKLSKKVDTFEKEKLHRNIKNIIKGTINMDCIYNIINNIKKEDKYFFEQEIKMLLNIEYSTNIIEYKINKKIAFGIKFNNRICLDEKCYNKSEKDKDYCYFHIEKHKSIFYYSIIDDETTYYVSDIV